MTGHDGIAGQDEQQNARRIVEAFVVIDLDVLRILKLEAGNVVMRDVLVDAHVTGLSDVDPGIVGTGDDVAVDPAAARKNGKDSIQLVVVHGIGRNRPAVDAGQEDSAAVEIAHDEARDFRAPDVQSRIVQALSGIGIGSCESDAVILARFAARVLEDCLLPRTRLRDQADVVLRDDDRAELRGIGRTGLSGLVVGAGLDHDAVAGRCRIHSALDRLAGAHLDVAGGGAFHRGPDQDSGQQHLHRVRQQQLFQKRTHDGILPSPGNSSERLRAQQPRTSLCAVYAKRSRFRVAISG